MAVKVEWQSYDYATQKVLAEIIDNSGLAYRSIANKIGGFVSHVRIGYIHNGERAPAKVSEFLAICNACDADPIEAIRKISELSEKMSIPSQTSDEEAVAEMVRQASNPEAYGLAANRDENKESEALGDAGPDWSELA